MPREGGVVGLILGSRGKRLEIGPPVAFLSFFQFFREENRPTVVVAPAPKAASPLPRQRLRRQKCLYRRREIRPIDPALFRQTQKPIAFSDVGGGSQTAKEGAVVGNVVHSREVRDEKLVEAAVVQHGCLRFLVSPVFRRRREETAVENPARQSRYVAVRGGPIEEDPTALVEKRRHASIGRNRCVAAGAHHS